MVAVNVRRALDPGCGVLLMRLASCAIVDLPVEAFHQVIDQSVS
jgi:hypothetical protein